MLFIAMGCVVAAAVAGFLVARLRAKADVARVVAERDSSRQERERTEVALAGTRALLEQAQTQRAASVARAAHLEGTREQMESVFTAAAQRALNDVGASLVQMNKTQVDGSLDTKKVEIEGLLKPLREMLDTYRGEVLRGEKIRAESYGDLQAQIRALLTAQESAQREAARLANALQSPTVQGSWGEMSLKRCIELAGMSEYCRDFETQPTFITDEGKRLRPDIIIHLPNRRVIAIDAKAPLTEYIAASNETDEARRRLLLEHHAKNIRRHIDALSRREYQASIGDTLDFTVMFIPGEHFLAAALAADTTLLEYAAERRVFLASPTVLLPLLRATAASWKAERTEENAKRMHDAGVELFNRFVKAMDLVADVGASLGRTVESYNKAIRSIETRLWPKGEEMQRMAGSGKELGELKQLEAVPIESGRLKLRSQNEEEGEVLPFES